MDLDIKRGEVVDLYIEKGEVERISTLREVRRQIFTLRGEGGSGYLLGIRWDIILRGERKEDIYIGRGKGDAEVVFVWKKGGVEVTEIHGRKNFLNL